MIYQGSSDKIKYIANFKENSTEELSFFKALQSSIEKKYSLKFKIPTVVKANPGELKDMILHKDICIFLKKPVVVEKEFTASILKSISGTKSSEIYFNEILNTEHDAIIRMYWDNNLGFCLDLSRGKINKKFKVNNNFFFREIHSSLSNNFSTKFKECVIGYDTKTEEYKILNLVLMTAIGNPGITIIAHPSYAIETEQSTYEVSKDPALVNKYILYILMNKDHETKAISDINYLIAKNLLANLFGQASGGVFLEKLKNLINGKNKEAIEKAVFSSEINEELPQFSPTNISSYLEEFKFEDEKEEILKNTILNTSEKDLVSERKYLIENMRWRYLGNEGFRIQLQSSKLINFIKVGDLVLHNSQAENILSTEFGAKPGLKGEKLQSVGNDFDFYLPSNHGTNAKYNPLYFSNEDNAFYALNKANEKVILFSRSAVNNLLKGFDIEVVNNEFKKEE